jgi:ceramide glucosyltransferase
MIAEACTAGLSALGLLQATAGAALLRQFARRRDAAPARAVPVTVLKPLHGDEPLLEQALASVCRQNYPDWQVVFGVQSASDGALPVVRRLQAQYADCNIAVVVDPTEHGPNRKVGNLINMLPAAEHNVLVIADSDVHVASDWLRQAVAALEIPGVGLVTAVYTGRPAHGLVGMLGACQINHYFLPGALLARAMGRQDCLGATMMLRRETLDRIGGLRALVDHLADDNVLGRLVQRLGLNVALAATIPATTVSETTFGALWRHEQRWARTIRALVPLQFAASILQFPLAWAALTILLADGAPWSLAGFVLVWGLRATLVRVTDNVLALANRTPLWLLPLRELMSVVVMAASYAGRRVDWRGHILEAEGFNPR